MQKRNLKLVQGFLETEHQLGKVRLFDIYVYTNVGRS